MNAQLRTSRLDGLSGVRLLAGTAALAACALSAGCASPRRADSGPTGLHGDQYVGVPYRRTGRTLTPPPQRARGHEEWPPVMTSGPQGGGPPAGYAPGGASADFGALPPPPPSYAGRSTSHTSLMPALSGQTVQVPAPAWEEPDAAPPTWVPPTTYTAPTVIYASQQPVRPTTVLHVTPWVQPRPVVYCPPQPIQVMHPIRPMTSWSAYPPRTVRRVAVACPPPVRRSGVTIQIGGRSSRGAVSFDRQPAYCPPPSRGWSQPQRSSWGQRGRRR